MNKLPSASSLPASIQQVSTNLKWAGLIGFWLQLLIGVVSSVFLAIAAAASNLVDQTQATKGTEVGIFFAICALISLAISIYFYIRYYRIAQSLRNPNPARRPKKADTLRFIRLGLIVNIAGTSLALMGTQAVVGVILLFKSSIQIPTIGADAGTARYVLPSDMFNIAANTATVTAHFIGLLITLWLLNQIDK